MRTGADLARTFDYWSPAFAPDPYPLLRRLRADCPVAHSDELDGLLHPVALRGRQRSPARPRHLHFHRDDGTGHTGRGTPRRSRRSIRTRRRTPATGSSSSPFFTPARAASLEAVARDTARKLAAACTGTIEAYMSYCFPMPTVVISQILGVDAADYRRFEDVDRIDRGRPRRRPWRRHRRQHGDARIPRGAAGAAPAGAA